MKQNLALFFASACYLGMIPGAPGTYASVATAFILYLGHQFSQGIRPELHLSALCLISAAGVLASSEVSRNRGLKDPQNVVIDEVAGQLLTFFMLDLNLLNLVLGIVLFRLFDIWKPYPIRKLEVLPNGVGIMADDLLAGVYANLLLRLVNWSIHSP